MAAPNIARQWFVPGEGIVRQVISADIQRYLGNDATVRPGMGTNENEGVEGYWIKAYRTLTSAMMEDLKADSAKWKLEQRMGGQRDAHPGPITHQPNTTRVRQGDNSPRNPEHGLNVNRDGRPLPPRGNPGFVENRMDIDAPSRPNFPHQDRMYVPEGRSMYAPDGRPYAPEPPQSHGPGYNPAYGHSHADYPPAYPAHDGGMPGYARHQGGYYPPTSAYEAGQPMPGRNEPPYAVGPYNGPQPPIRGPPMYGQPEYQDPRYAYPSPAVTTVSSVSGRDRETLPGGSLPPRFASSTGPPSSYHHADSDSGYGQAPPPPPQYDSYGRPIVSPSQPSPTLADPALARGPGAIRRPASITDTREAQRRRL